MEIVSGFLWCLSLEFSPETCLFGPLWGAEKGGGQAPVNGGCRHDLEEMLWRFSGGRGFFVEESPRDSFLPPGMRGLSKPRIEEAGVFSF